MDGHQLAQINIARLRAPIDSPILADFVAGLDPVNALAESSAGFVWRFQTEDGNATAVRPYDDDLVIINISVWESPEALADFVFRSGHTAFLRRRRDWFDSLDEVAVALWWVPCGHRPSVEEAVRRLEHLRRHGPCATAFTLRRPFPAPSGAVDTDVKS
jgi:hypothetical protein